MKGGAGQHALTNKVMATKPPKHMRTKGNGKPGMKFDGDRFASLCIERGFDPALSALKLLANPADVESMKPKELLEAYIKLMEYGYAKKRAVEHSGSIDVTLPELLALADKEWHAAGKPDKPVEG